MLSLTLKRVKTTFKQSDLTLKRFSTAPLEGIRVLDLTRIVAGPYCTQILGDLGADVIKIEKPGGGDEARLWGPPYIPSTTTSCYFVAFNRNKRSVCINIHSPRGQSILHSLALKADVLVENFIPGKLDSLHLGYEELSNKAPQLIYCSISGFGPHGPYSQRPGYDVIAGSIGGLLHITGPPDGEPCKPGVALIDIATGLYAHGAIMAALIKRTRTGRGQKIDCDLLSTQMASLINIGSNYLNAAQEATRWGTAHPSIVPYQAFKTKDGYFTVGTGSDQQYAELCSVLGRPDLTGPQFGTNKDRVANRAALIAILCDIFMERTNAEWADQFSTCSFPNGPVNDLRAAFDHPQVRHRGLVQTVVHPTGGTVKMVGPPVLYSEGGNEVRTAPPTLGQHTNEVLTELGLSEEEIEELRRDDVIA